MTASPLKLRTLAELIGLALLFPAVALAEEPEPQQETMVVTATGYEQRIEDAPASVTVIPGEELRKKICAKPR
ncbi:hypothetical protein [Erwinia sp. E_sp_B01_9]|uniref:hypothetical protein n=1 Tax=Erwinia sp. E_sp_B01_9 TaxID=3039403 RepID=UPI003D9B09F7